MFIVTVPLRSALQRSAMYPAATCGSAGAVINSFGRGYKHLVPPGPEQVFDLVLSGPTGDVRFGPLRDPGGCSIWSPPGPERLFDLVPPGPEQVFDWSLRDSKQVRETYLST